MPSCEVKPQVLPALGLVLVSMVTGLGAAAETLPWQPVPMPSPVAELRVDPLQARYLVREVGRDWRCRRSSIDRLIANNLSVPLTAARDGTDRPHVVIESIVAELADGQIGERMSEADHHCLSQALTHAADGEAVSWRNDEVDTEFRVVPSGTFNEGAARECRHYMAEMSADGQRYVMRDRACKTAEGGWQKAIDMGRRRTPWGAVE